jgi:hypothetical protein
MRGNRLARFFYGTPNLVGMGLALLGLGLFFSGLIKSYWFFIVAGLYGAGFFATPQRPEEIRHLDEKLEIEALRKEFEDFLRRVKKRLSIPVLGPLAELEETLKGVLNSMDKLPQGSDGRHAVHQTLARYLPEMIHDYLELPPAFARFHAVRDGKAPREILIEQLSVLNQEFTEILANLHSEQVDKLESHGKFLQQRFNRKASVFEVM